MNDFVDALRFLTRLPVPPARAGAGFGARAFPLVGLAIGLLLVVVDRLAGALGPAIRSVAIVATGALVTGALHYDALADVLDAAGGTTRKDRLRIMRDGTVGSYAVLGLVLVVAAELACLGALPDDVRRRALLVAPVVGRLAMVVCAFEAPLARPDGLGAAFVGALRSSDRTFAALTAIVVVAVVGGMVGIFAGLIAVAASYTLRRMATTAFGGVTGDVIGACGKVAELVALLGFVSR